MDLREAEQFESVEKNGATMGKRNRSMMVETAQKRVAIESAESWQMRCACATESLRIEVKKVSFRNISLQAIPDSMHLDHSDR